MQKLGSYIIADHPDQGNERATNCMHEIYRLDLAVLSDNGGEAQDPYLSLISTSIISRPSLRLFILHYFEVTLQLWRLGAPHINCGPKFRLHLIGHF